MTQVLVTYFSSTGNTKAMAEAVAAGVWSVEGVECVLKTVPQTTNDDWLGFRSKQMFDVTAKIYGQLEGKVGAAFTTSGGAGCGHETTNMSIITAMLVAGMVVQGTTQGPHFGPFAVEAPDEKALRQAREMGVRVATLAQRLAVSHQLSATRNP